MSARPRPRAGSSGRRVPPRPGTAAPEGRVAASTGVAASEGRVAASTGVAASEDDARVGAVFAALADPTRRDVLRRLTGGATVTASGLAEGLPMTRQAAAKHLRALADAGLVAGAREGRETRYRIVPGALDDAAAWMAHAGARWDDRLERLRRRVDGAGGAGG